MLSTKNKYIIILQKVNIYISGQPSLEPGYRRRISARLPGYFSQKPAPIPDNDRRYDRGGRVFA